MAQKFVESILVMGIPSPRRCIPPGKETLCFLEGRIHPAAESHSSSERPRPFKVRDDVGLWTGILSEKLPT